MDPAVRSCIELDRHTELKLHVARLGIDYFDAHDALHCAIGNSSGQCVQVLVDAGANLLKQSRRGIYPIDVLAARYDPDNTTKTHVLGILLTAEPRLLLVHAGVRNNIIMHQIDLDNLEIFTAAFDQLPRDQQMFQDLAVMYALDGSFGVMMKLLRYVDDINFVIRRGREHETLLHVVAAMSRVYYGADNIKHLLALGADPTALDERGRRPCDLAYHRAIADALTPT